MPVSISVSSPLSQSSPARGPIFLERYSKVPVSSFSSLSPPILVDAPMICQDSQISLVSGLDFLITSECTPDLAEALARGQDLQIVPGYAMGQLWESMVGVPPTPVISASPQVGGSALCGTESARIFQGLGG